MTMNPDALDRWITGNYGEDQFDESLIEEREEVEGVCSHCELGLDSHREVNREDQYGNEWEGIVCPPDGCREEPMLSHWVEFGCYDFDLIEATGDNGGSEWWCTSCGASVGAP